VLPTLGVQPHTEGVHRAKGGVDRHRTEAVFSLLRLAVFATLLRSGFQALMPDAFGQPTLTALKYHHCSHTICP
jgi:hypothetical protein